MATLTVSWVPVTAKVMRLPLVLIFVSLVVSGGQFSLPWAYVRTVAFLSQLKGMHVYVCWDNDGRDARGRKSPRSPLHCILSSTSKEEPLGRR